MKKIIVFLVVSLFIFSCVEEKIEHYYKVVLDNRGQLINNDVFHEIIDRTREITNKSVILYFEKSRLSLYFEKNFDTNNIKKIILDERLDTKIIILKKDEN